jgi:hypothetical protein
MLSLISRRISNSGFGIDCWKKEKLFVVVNRMRIIECQMFLWQISLAVIVALNFKVYRLLSYSLYYILDLEELMCEECRYV